MEMGNEENRKKLKKRDLRWAKQETSASRSRLVVKEINRKKDE